MAPVHAAERYPSSHSPHHAQGGRRLRERRTESGGSAGLGARTGRAAVLCPGPVGRRGALRTAGWRAVRLARFAAPHDLDEVVTLPSSRAAGAADFSSAALARARIASRSPSTCGSDRSIFSTAAAAAAVGRAASSWRSSASARAGTSSGRIHSGIAASPGVGCAHPWPAITSSASRGKIRNPKFEIRNKMRNFKSQ